MTTQQQIDDPGQWRVGDDVRIEWPNGSVLAGKISASGGCLRVQAGPVSLIVRNPDGSSRFLLVVPRTTITVTRTVEPTPEPTVPWALVKFADGTVWVREDETSEPWGNRGYGSWDWAHVTEECGAPVAVSLPRWSDEVDGDGPDDAPRLRVLVLQKRLDGLRAGVQREVERMEHDLATRLNTSGSHAVVAQDAVLRIVHNLRALLAEGGEA